MLDPAHRFFMQLALKKCLVTTCSPPAHLPFPTRKDPEKCLFRFVFRPRFRMYLINQAIV